MSILPAFSFPCTILCLDDNVLFIQELQKMIHQKFNVQVFHSPTDALGFLKNHKSILTSEAFFRAESADDINGTEQSLVNLDVRNITELASNTDRFNEIGVLLVDYQMPDMNGIEFCKQLSSQPYKKILLTGEADSEIALAAFNAGIIDCYIQKDDPNLYHNLLNYIDCMVQSFFAEITIPIRQLLRLNSIIPINDNMFINNIYQRFKEYDIKEFYLADKNGSMLLIDKFGNKSYLIVHTESSLNEFINAYDDEQYAMPFIDHIKQRTRLPFFDMIQPHYDTPISEWDQYFIAPNVISGTQQYYWHEKKLK